MINDISDEAGDQQDAKGCCGCLTLLSFFVLIAIFIIDKFVNM